ncbi:hypothetical protein BZA05DRAFT_382701 [Tricharina praecox]|uniref:uncharacterized protein n=1 Tax=Tricharina praecox TaxID=43433 RepID=UPI00221EA595|nr:uncharacterized protein BZA05DRAFT_382701 [Tricharina praecox]KAI5858893.1 hypothetical protein BZA05DRAFT_382701 [Tricharina praecox]
MSSTVVVVVAVVVAVVVVVVLGGSVSYPIVSPFPHLISSRSCSSPFQIPGRPPLPQEINPKPHSTTVPVNGYQGCATKSTFTAPLHRAVLVI